MIYNKLASIYDGLVKDEEATQTYVAFLDHFLPSKGKFLELGCGSGEITIALAQKRHQNTIVATDLSSQMIEVAKKKNTLDNLTFEVMDMRNLPAKDKYAAIYCICDSINYLTNDEVNKLIQNAYQLLDDQGVLIFDMHSLDRLSEFEDEFYEAGVVDGVDYTWSIISDHQDIIQNFIFYDENANRTYEHHIQHVFDPKQILQCLKDNAFDAKLWTDFALEGIQAGEKYFIVAKKGESI